MTTLDPREKKVSLANLLEAATQDMGRAELARFRAVLGDALPGFIGWAAARACNKDEDGKTKKETEVRE